MKTYIQQNLEEHSEVISAVHNLIPEITEVAEQMIVTVKNGGTIYWIGNGGSAADAQHLAAELVGRFAKERKAISSVALVTNNSILTSLANDYDYAIIFARQLQACCRVGDLVIGISTSGNSQNVVLGLEEAKKQGVGTIAFMGSNEGKIAQFADLKIKIPSTITARIQEAHILIGHILCQLVEESVTKEE